MSPCWSSGFALRNRKETCVFVSLTIDAFEDEEREQAVLYYLESGKGMLS